MNGERFTAPAPAGSSPVEYASFARRLGAALLDSLIWIIGLGFFNPIGAIGNETAATIVAFLILSAWFNYFAFCEWRWGQTIGKNATGIRVLALEGGRVSWQAAALRNILRLVDLPLAMLGIDYLIVRGSERRQRLGDRAAKTIVVRERTEELQQPVAQAQRGSSVPAPAPAAQPGIASVPPPQPPYGGAGAPTAGEIFGDAAEALGRHPAAGSLSRSETKDAPTSIAAASPPDLPNTSSWTAAGFPYPNWEVRRTVFGLLAGLLVALFAPLLVVPFDPDLDSTGALLVAQTLFVGALIVVSIRVASGGERQGAIPEAAAMLGLRRFRRSAFGWMALGFFAYFVFAVLYGTLITQPEQEDIARDLGLDTGPLAAVAVALLIAVVAPISEEIFFRGMLFGGLRRRLPTIAAALISAAVFGALHAPTGITAVPPLIFFGFVLALLYERTGSLGPPIVVHAINNALALAVTA